MLDQPPEDDADAAPHRVYNIGNNRSEKLMRFIGLIEDALGQKAEIEVEPMQEGDVKETYADIDAIKSKFGFNPKTTIEEGIPKFVAWYRDYHGVCHQTLILGRPAFLPGADTFAPGWRRDPPVPPCRP